MLKRNSSPTGKASKLKPDDDSATGRSAAGRLFPDGGGPEAATEWFWETDSSHRYSYVSSQSLVATGLDKAQILGRRREDFAIDRDAPKWAQHLADLEARRPFWRFEYSIRKPDGRLVHLSVSGEPRFDEQGLFLGYRGGTSDITERREIEEKLREATELFQAVLDHAPFGIVLKDRDGRYLEVSREWQRRFGVDRDRVVGKTSSEVLPSDLAESYKARDMVTLARGEKVVREERLHNPDREDEYYLTTRFPMRDRDGNITGIGLVSADITDRKLAELGQEESERQIRTIADSLPALISRQDREWRYRFINREGAKWYGADPSQIVGRSIRDILSAETCDAIRPAINTVLSGEPASYTGRIDYPDGKTRLVTVDYVPDRDAHGAVQGWFAISHDITERENASRALRDSESQMRTITDNLPVFIAYLDNDMRYRFVNRTVEQWYRIDRTEIIGRRVEDIVQPETYARLQPRIEKVLAGQRISFEDSLIYPNGERRDAEMSWIPDIDESGRVHGWFALVHDITLRKRLENELVRRERLATMGQLTGTVAHELRNPLGAVASSVTTLRRRTDAAGLDVERSLGRAERGVRRCERIITELLDFARAKGQQREPTLLGDWISALLAEQNIPPGVTLVTVLPDLGIELAIDREDLRRAIINVLDNAFQAVDAVDGGRIEIGYRTAGGRLFCEIRDNGPGIPPENLDRVVEPLFSTKSFGTGLGLPTVQRIMEEHGGGLEIESEPGNGALVRLWMPFGHKQT